MLDNAHFVQVFVSDKVEDDLKKRLDIRYAIERGLQNIGEAAFQLRRAGKPWLSRITGLDRIIAMRHVLVHGYDEVKPDVIWDISTNKLGLLIQELEQLLSSPDCEQS